MSPATDSANKYVALWVLASLLACFPALAVLSAAVFDGEYLPVGNDAFYHARRILDAASGHFYQFDPKIHVPEGSWLVWPWAYDYLMGQAVRLGTFLFPTIAPMQFLAYVPVAWLLVNIGLFTLIVRSSRLSLPMGAPIVLAFAILPLNQVLHGVGMVDHHFIELSFVLAVVWLGQVFYRTPTARNGIFLGVALGIAPGFHTSLFILQIPVLLTAAIIWLRSSRVDWRASAGLSGALLLSSLAIALPSEPFRQLFFEFKTLSLFHPYIAFCSATCLILLARLEYSLRNLAIMVAVGTVLTIPIAYEILVGANYLVGGQAGLPEIIEVASPFEIWRRTGDISTMTRYFSWLILLAPCIGLWAIYRVFRFQLADSLYLYVSIVFGLSLLLLQFRFQSFGSWALLVAPAVLVAHLMKTFAQHAKQIGIAALCILLASFISPARHILTETFPPAGNLEYAAIHDSLKVLADICEESPGTVLAMPDDGHPIRYQTDCSVIANNFLLTPLQTEKFVFVEELLQGPANELASAAPEADYLLVHLSIVFSQSATGVEVTPIDIVRRYSLPLFVELALDAEVPDNFELLHERRMPHSHDMPYVQIYRIHR